MKIKFICPTREWLRVKQADAKPEGSFFLRLPTLTAATIAGLTPSDFDFELIDEQIDYLDFDAQVDLVAITCNTATANRAYEIAKKYKKRNIPVVLGGIHPTLNSDEAKNYGTVVIGSAEPVWGRLLQDFKANKLKDVYQSSPEEVDFAKPDRSIYKGKKFATINLVEATRGCIHHCNFCTTASAFQGEHITKDINLVVEDIKSLKGKTIIFADDNLIANPDYAKKLFKALIPLKIKWGSQVSYLFGLDEELLDLAKKSGCIGVFIGFDSISEEALADYHKDFGKVDLYKKAISNIHKKGILIQGSFIFGSDADKKENIATTLDFIEQNHIDGVFFGIYTPLPRTPAFERIQKEGRITSKNLDNYDYRHCVFKPKNMTSVELEQNVQRALDDFFQTKKVLNRLLKRLPMLFSQGSILLFAGYYLAFLSRIKMLRRVNMSAKNTQDAGIDKAYLKGS